MNFNVPDVCRLMDLSHLGVGASIGMGCGMPPTLPTLPSIPTFHLDIHTITQTSLPNIIAAIPEASIPFNPEPPKPELLQLSESIDHQLHAINPSVCKAKCQEIKNNVYATCGTTNAFTAVIERKPQKMLCLQAEAKKYDQCVTECTPKKVDLPPPTPEVIAKIKDNLQSHPSHTISIQSLK